MEEVIIATALIGVLVGIFVGRLLVKEDLKFLRKFYDEHSSCEKCDDDRNPFDL